MYEGVISHDCHMTNTSYLYYDMQSVCSPIISVSVGVGVVEEGVTVQAMKEGCLYHIFQSAKCMQWSLHFYLGS